MKKNMTFLFFIMAFAFNVPEFFIGAAVAEGVSARISSFRPASGNFSCGERAVSSLEIKNTGAAPASFWIGYSVRDCRGVWLDAPFTGPVELKAGAVSAPVAIAWTVPDNGSFRTGNFTVRMALWAAPPNDPSALRLDFADRQDAFHANNRNLEKTFRAGELEIKPTYDTCRPNNNRGMLLFGNVSQIDSAVAITIPKKSFDGGEIFSVDRFGYGVYSLKMRLPAEKLKSVTGFFLFDPDSEDEITMELFNDGSRRVWMTSFIGGGEPLEKVERVLSFDPSADSHEYSIRYSKGNVEFSAGGKVIGTISDKEEKKIVPDKTNMRVHVNQWFPGWIELKPFSDSDRPSSDQRVLISDLKIVPDKKK